MASLEITITLKSPLISGRPRQGSVMKTYSYVPGSVLRGALAGVLMSEWTPEQRAVAHPEDCPDRAACSLCSVLYPLEGEQPRFSDCHPVLRDSDGLTLLPLSAMTCKQFGGFLSYKVVDRERELENHGIQDTLIRQAAARDAAAARQDLPYWYTLTCPICREALEPPEGAAFGEIGDVRYIAKPIIRRFSRTAINRRRGTAQDGQLFTLEVIGEQMTLSPGLPGVSEKKKTKIAATSFRGQLDPGGAPLEDLKKALRNVTALGSSASRGMGEVAEVRIRRGRSMKESGLSPADFCAQINEGHFKTAQNSGALLERIVSFNAAIAGERAFYKAMDLEVLPGPWYFTLDLLSPAFHRHLGLPTLQLTPQMLGLPGGVTLDFEIVESLERGGWSNAWGLPRARQVGMAAGSVFMYRVDTTDAEEIALIIERLRALEENGAGSDRVRGAGRLQVCAPFHQEVEPV